MRCPSCGTENAPDSRFCGGCGARLEPPRVAPTVKLHDDAPIPTPPPGSIGHLPTPPPGTMSYPHGPASIPPTNHRLASQPGYAPASIPPTNHNPISRPPASQPPVSQPPSSPPVQRRASTPAPAAVSSPSLSMPMPPRRSGAMIAIVLVIDLALAVAGATLLFKGLAKPRAADARAAKTELHAQGSAAAAPVAAAVAPPAAAPSASAGSAAPEPPAPPAADKTLARDPKKKAASAKADRASNADRNDRKTGSGPLDPYGGGAPAPDQSAEIEAHGRESFGAFRRCFEDAIHAGPIHGDVRIAFVVEPDGHVDHASPVVNTTGSDALASCLAQTIGSWTFAPHSGAAASYERPFNYP